MYFYFMTDFDAGRLPKCVCILSKLHCGVLLEESGLFHGGSTKGRFPLPEFTARVDGCQKCTRVHGPSTRPVNSGSGNRPPVHRQSVPWTSIDMLPSSVRSRIRDHAAIDTKHTHGEK